MTAYLVTDKRQSVEGFSQTTDKTEVFLTSHNAEVSVPSEIKVSLTDDSWINIVDSTGNIVADKIFVAGDDILLLGFAPLKVIIGNSQAVNLKFNGKNISYSDDSELQIFTLPLPTM